MFAVTKLVTLIADFDFSSLALFLCSLILFFIRHQMEETKRKSIIKESINDNLKTNSENDLPALKSYPILGWKNALKKHLHKELAEVAEKEFDNKIFQVKAGSRRFVVFSNYEDILHIVKTYPDELYGKPHSFTTGKVSVGAHNDMLERWKKRRAFVNSGLKHLEKYAINDIMSEEIEVNLMEHFDSAADGIESRDMRHEITYYISRVLYKMSYTNAINEQTDVHLKKFIHDLPDYTASMGSFSRYDMFPFLRFFFRSQYKKFIDFNQMMKNFCREQKNKFSSICDGRVSLLSFFSEKLAKFDKSSLSNKMPDLKESLFDGLEDIIRAGTESTSLIIQWSIAYVVKYQHVQLNMQTEIDSLLKEKNKLKPDLDDFEHLHYCRAVLAETHRFCSLNPFLKRQLTGDIVTKDGYHLNKGTNLLFNNWALNFNKSSWKNPEQFYPERFLDESGKFDDSKFEKLFSFGFGKRRCIGVYTGRSLCFLAAVNIFNQFKLTEEVEIDIEPIDGIGLSPKPFKVFIERR